MFSLCLHDKKRWIVSKSIQCSLLPQPQIRLLRVNLIKCSAIMKIQINPKEEKAVDLVATCRTWLWQLAHMYVDTYFSCWQVKNIICKKPLRVLAIRCSTDDMDVPGTAACPCCCQCSPVPGGGVGREGCKWYSLCCQLSNSLYNSVFSLSYLCIFQQSVLMWVMLNSLSWAFWKHFLARDCTLNLDQSSSTCRSLVPRRERNRLLMVPWDSLPPL